jgi:methylmalonyl-CoA/ethylmalonyl-CoA epimerase
VDLGRAVSFYRDVLGLRFLFQAPPSLAFFDCGGVRLMLDSSEESRNPVRSPILYYHVDDLDAAFAEVSSGGAVVVARPHLVATLPDHELWMAFLEDSERNLLALMSERRSVS